jgi:hypothetical protein
MEAFVHLVSDLLLPEIDTGIVTEDQNVTYALGEGHKRIKVLLSGLLQTLFSKIYFIRCLGLLSALL